MKKQLSRWPVLLSLFAVVLVTGCDKENDDNTPPPKTNTEHISSSSWKFQSASASGTDISSNPLLACFVDNVITFNSNLTGVIDEATIICTPTTAGNFTWGFLSNETQLQLSTALFPGGSSTFSIVTLNSTNLVLSQNVVVPPSSSPIPVTVTFRH